MVRPRLTISAVSVRCCWRRSMADSKITVSASTAVITRLSLSLSGMGPTTLAREAVTPIGSGGVIHARYGAGRGAGAPPAGGGRLLEQRDDPHAARLLEQQRHDEGVAALHRLLQHTEHD